MRVSELQCVVWCVGMPWENIHVTVRDGEYKAPFSPTHTTPTPHNRAHTSFSVVPSQGRRAVVLGLRKKKYRAQVQGLEYQMEFYPSYLGLPVPPAEGHVSGPCAPSMPPSMPPSTAPSVPPSIKAKEAIEVDATACLNQNGAPPPSWACGSCTLLNSATSKVCTACATLRGSQGLVVGTRKRKQPESFTPDEWTREEEAEEDEFGNMSGSDVDTSSGIGSSATEQGSVRSAAGASGYSTTHKGSFEMLSGSAAVEMHSRSAAIPDQIDLSRFRAKRNKTGYRGVKLERSGKFTAGIAVPGVGHKPLGMYPTAEEAAEVYARAYLRLHGAAPGCLECEECGMTFENAGALTMHTKSHQRAAALVAEMQSAVPGAIDLSQWQTGSKAGYKGVSKEYDRFVAYIQMPESGKTNLGTYNTAEEAARVYARAHIYLKLHGTPPTLQCAVGEP